MKNFYFRLLTAAFLCATISAKAQTIYKLDWASSFGTWANGQTSGTATSIGSSGVNCSVTMTASGGVFSVTSTTPAYQTPTVTNSVFYVPGSASCMRINMDFTTNTQYTDVVYNFSTPVTGIKFNVVDIDKVNAASTTYHDKIIVTGSNGSSLYFPVLNKYVVSSDVLGLVAGNTAVANITTTGGGNSASSTTDQTGTVTVDFGTAVLKTVTIRYTNGENTDADPAVQAIGIGNLGFQMVNVPPVANNFTNVRMLQGQPATSIPGLVANDADGTIASYTITSVPAAAQGTLSIPCPATPSGATCTGGFADLTPAVLSANSNAIVLTPTQAAGLRFDPASTFAGTALFTYTATDNLGSVSNSATYRLPVLAQPPVANNIMENSIVNSAAATAILPLNASDADGIVSTYQIINLPLTTQGVLSVPCPTTFTNATCTGGYQDLTASVLSAYPSGIPLTPTQAAGMRFDPTAGYVGKANFDYNAVDNSGNTSTTANYTIPVAATVTSAKPPLADNITAQTLNSSLAATDLPGLQAIDLDGTVASYKILTIPNTATQGTLSCCGGSAVAVNQVLTPAQAATLQFDPLATFTGTVSFTYTATDNASLVGNTAMYNIPVVNRTPVSTNLNVNVPFNAAAMAISPLSGYDADGTIASYTITSVPAAAQGTLSIPCPATPSGATCTGGFADLTPAVLSANSNAIVLTPTQAAGIRFAPASNFTGTASFTYTSTDNNNNISAAAIYNFMVDARPPVSVDVNNTTLANSAAATTISGLSATDADGTIASFTILTLPPTTQGVVSIPCPITLTGATCTGGYQDLTATILSNYPSGIPLTTAQAAVMKFDPAAGFTGVASFTYTATDNDGFMSNTSAFNIPVSGTGNIQPIAKNIASSPLSNTAAATAISALVGNDPDGTIASYTITSVPAAAQGTLSIPCPATPSGATCTGGFADLTPAVLSANSNAIVLTPTQAAGLRFDPTSGYVGSVNFTYTTTDNTSAVSYAANYTIPVTGVDPIAKSVTTTGLAQTASATAIPALVATDVDGTIANYYITNLPPASQGVLSIPCPATLTGATCTGGFQDLTAAVLANYPLGIPLTTTQAAGMRFDPAAGYTGNVVFNYYAQDNSGAASNLASYTIPVSGLNPQANDVVSTKLLNGNSAVAISPLNSVDGDGTINSFIITSIPPTTQGVLSIPCPATPSGATCTGGFADLTAAVLTANPGGISLTPAQAAALRFDPAAGFIGNASFNYGAYDNSNNLSNIATFSIPVGSSTTLALSLLTLSGERNGNNIVVNWKAEAEKGLDRYEIEYSTDGVNFVKGGTTLARNQAVSNYTFTLYNYTAPVYYIRLKALETADAKTKYSEIVIIRLGANFISTLSLTPNPVVSKMNVKITSATGGAGTLRIISMIGETVYQQAQTMVRGDNLLSISNLHIANGSYLLQVTINGENLSQKFIINR